MHFSEEQIRSVVEIKDLLSKEIEEHEAKIEILKKNITILDLILKQSSFTKASEMVSISEPVKPDTNSIPLTKGADGEVIANAFVSPDQVSIVLNEEIGLDAETPPFKSFFLDRIIGEMKRKDDSDVENGKIQRDLVIDYVINKNDSKIREIIIKNYRQKERINEIINTAAWSLSRMLENKNK